MNVVQAETQTYDEMWHVSSYAETSPGEHLAPLFEDMIRPLEGGRLPWRAASVLDAGTGSGKGAVALMAKGFRVTACDLTNAGLVDEAKGIPFHRAALWDDLTRIVGFHDYAYCCDVMEHIPPPFTMLVVSRLLQVARRGVFLSISLVPDHYGAWVGKPLHQSVQSYTQWRDQLDTVGELVEARDMLTSGVYLVKARC
jgi:2-polyprenyl-3-methyl-5-hydroxy-6-metoxy-1,4-benzoquinol methylase